MPPLGPPKLTPEQRVLAQWRGMDVSPAEKALRPSAQSVGNIMPKVLTELRIDRRQSEAEIARVWNNLIDPSITAHATPTGIHKGTLFVTVDSNVWLDEIVRYRRKEILDRLQHSFGKDIVTRISFRLG
jgi:predicted nucleic acid-binding Zn ribbon protein